MNEALWYLSRATGVASMALLTVTFILGMATAGRRSPTAGRPGASAPAGAAARNGIRSSRRIRRMGLV